MFGNPFLALTIVLAGIPTNPLQPARCQARIAFLAPAAASIAPKANVNIFVSLLLRQRFDELTYQIDVGRLMLP
jgi:hypothetical protein